MISKSRKIIKALENKLEKGYSLRIFKGYVAVDKRGVEKLINELYSSLEDEVKQAQIYLDNRNIVEKSDDNNRKHEIFKYLNKLEIYFNQSWQFLRHSIISSQEAENIINEITENFPQEIIQAEKTEK